MKILHVIADLKPSSGGPPKAALEMCAGLAREGVDVSIYTTDLSDDGRLEVPYDQPVIINGVKIRYYNYGKIRKYPVSFALARALARDIPDFDLVHIHSVYLFHTSAAAYYCRKFKVPYIIRPHGSFNSFIFNNGRKGVKKLFLALLEKKNLMIAASVHYTAKDEEQNTKTILNIDTPSMIVPLGIDLKSFQSLPSSGRFREKFALPYNKKIILFIGRISPVKGLDNLSEAFGELLHTHPETILVLVGPKDKVYGDFVRDLLISHGAIDNAIFTGMLLGHDKLSALVDADILILPSYSENFGITLVEAMACGVPVITTDQVNIWREIQEAEAGIITQCNAGQLKDAMIKLLDNPDLCVKMGENGKILVEKSYSQKEVASNLIDAYQRILDRSHREK